MVTRAEREERRRIAEDLAAQELGPPLVNRQRCATAYIRATRPDGVPVTFVPGEALPEWVVRQLDSGRATFDEKTGAWTLAGKR